MDASLFVQGSIDKIPDALLEGRMTTEGNVCGCLLSDLTYYDDCGIEDSSTFLTKHGRLLFSIGRELRSKGFNQFDEVTMLSNLNEDLKDKIKGEIGDFNKIQHLTDVISIKNWDSIIDKFHKSNIIINLYKKGFNVTEEIVLNNGKKVVPYKLFEKMTSSQVLDWYESQITTLGTKINNTKIVEEGYVDFDDAFLESLINKEELGINFGNAGLDINGNTIHTFEFLSRQIMGLKHGTLSGFAAASGVGKSTWLVGLLMSLVSNGEHKVCLVSNESQVKDIKIQFLSWFCSRYLCESRITKTKLISGNLTDEEKDILHRAKQSFREQYGKAIKIVTLADADAHLTCQILKGAVLREGVDIVCVDTFKLTMDDSDNDNFWLSLVADTRALSELCLRYNVIGLMTIQLAIHSQNRAWLSADCLSQSKAIKEVLSNLILIRQAVPQLEFDKDSSYYINPFRSKQKEDGTWFDEPYEPAEGLAWRVVFVNKARRGATSDDTGICYLCRFDAEHSAFYETCKCRPTHKIFNVEM